MSRNLSVALVSTYDLGHQPFGLASPAAWLREAGAEVTCLDLAVGPLDRDRVAAADLVAFYVPMHTATRLTARLVPEVREVNPRAHLCAYGLYAPMNEALLRELGVQTIIGGEFEEPLAALAGELRAGTALTPSNLISLSRQRFRTPDRSDLPALERYACLRQADGSHLVAGYTEASRGCKHVCTHCPVVPVYGGRFRVVQSDVVLEDVRRQVKAGAGHITFGDPDFFNGPTHALRIVEAMHAELPELTYDVTIKVQHLRDHLDLLPALKTTGCVLVTTAVESFDERILAIFDKRHQPDDLVLALERLRALDIGLNPTFVAFTPWTTMDVYVDFLAAIADLGLIGSVAQVQYAIRLLVPSGSRLLEVPEMHAHLRGFDRDALCHRWRHPDPAVDELQQAVYQLVAEHVRDHQPRESTFAAVRDLTATYADSAQWRRLQQLDLSRPQVTIPYLTEPWFC